MVVVVVNDVVARDRLSALITWMTLLWRFFFRILISRPTGVMGGVVASVSRMVISWLMV